MSRDPSHQSGTPMVFNTPLSRKWTMMCNSSVYTSLSQSTCILTIHRGSVRSAFWLRRNPNKVQDGGNLLLELACKRNSSTDINLIATISRVVLKKHSSPGRGTRRCMHTLGACLMPLPLPRPNSHCDLIKWKPVLG